VSHYRLTKIQICFDSGEAFSGTAHYLLGEKLSALITRNVDNPNVMI